MPQKAEDRSALSRLTNDAASRLFAGDGEMRARCRAFDWASTPLGPVSTWSQSLRTTVSTMLGSLHPMFLWWGPELIQIFNDGYLPSFGTSGRDKIALGARGKDHWVDIWPVIWPQIEGVLTRGEATWHEDQLIPIERNGKLDNVWWTYGYSPVTDDDGSIAGVLVVVTETTSRVLAGMEREQLLESEMAARKDAETANRAKSDFLAMMSHELRTPLNSIGGHSSLLEMGIHGPVTPEQLGALKRIQQSQRHLLGLINGVLNYSRVEAGKIDYTITDVPMEEVLATCEALMIPQAFAKNQTLYIEPCKVPVMARGDRDKIQQVLLNLLSNAVKFTQPGGTVILGCTVQDETVAVTVKDTGRGIAPDQIEQVFQPFVQIDTKLTRDNEGTGLGLAISRDLAKGMGGDLAAKSEYGKGSEFTLTIPAATSDASSAL